MVGRMMIAGLVSIVVLPSCMHPVDHVLQVRAEQKRLHIEATGSVSQGACDDVGQYIAGNLSKDRLTMNGTAQVSTLSVR
jgi:hypothetical protein